MARPETVPAPSLSWRRAVRSPVLEALALLVSPAAAFFGLHVARMMPSGMIDPYFYMAYAQNGRDLVARYGDDYYYWVRLGFVLPARASHLLFGAVPGFYVLRYLLALVAVVPVYLLFRRLYGPAAGALAVAVVLSSPAILRAWGTNYPDSAAVSYLFAATACLLMPAASRRRRLVWVILAGVSFSLAVHAHPVSAPPIAAVVLVYAAINLRRAPLDVLLHLGLLALCALAVTGGLILMAQQVFGSSNLIMPTLNQARHNLSPREVAKWHSTNWRWVLINPYLLVLPAVVAGWWVAPRPGRSGPGDRTGLTVVVALALQGLAFAWLQFFGNGSTLEYYLYASMLWPGVCLVTAFLLVALCAPLLRRPATAALAVALVVALPLAITSLRSWVQFEMVPVGALVVVGLLAAVMVGRLLPERAVVAAVVAGLVVSGCFALMIGNPYVTGPLPGQAKLPQVRYDMVIWGDGRGELDAYRLASKLHLIVPRARFRGDDLMMWSPPEQRDRLDQPTAQYLWHVNMLRQTMPDLLRVDANSLRRRHPGLLLLLSETGAEFPAALRSLAAASFEPTVVRKDVLTGTSIRTHVWVVKLDNFRPPAWPVETGRGVRTAR